jgi:diguanylate cyclase (GGDEF)-like protein
MNLKTFHVALLVAIALTLCAMALPQYLPKKRLTLVPNTEIHTFIYSNKEEGDINHAVWVDKSQNHWRCVIGDSNEYLVCSFNLLFSAGSMQGMDLSGYSGMNIALEYRGDAPRMRLHIRSFDERFSIEEDTNSTKFHSVTVFTRDFERELYISLDELRVADWWLRQYNLPRHLSRPNFRRSLTLGLDFEDQLALGTHDIVIKKIELVGDRISSEDWYLGIISIWLLAAGVLVIQRLIQLHRQTQQDRQRIYELDGSNQQLLNESEKLKKISTTDALTGALNRHGLNQYLQKSSDSKLQNMALILMDIDHFKRINDRRGHDEGDRILVTLVSLVQCHVREQDFFGRWGGEEFILLCPNTTASKAFVLAEKIRILLSDTSMGGDKPLIITASFGVGELQSNEAFSAAFKRVDAALYKAKTLGRNCSVMADDTLA